MKKLLVLSAAIAALSTSAFAQTADAPALKFNPYLSVRMYAGVHNQDLAENSTYADNEADAAYRLQGNTRFGAKMAIENISGVMELGLDANNVNTSNSADAYLRLAFATWTAGDLKITIGQTYTPYTWVNPLGDVVDDNGMGGFGTTYDGRQPLISFSYSGLYISFIKPSTQTGKITGSKVTYTVTGNSALTDIKASYSVNDTTVLMPKTAIGYDYKADGFTAGLGGAMNYIKINDDGAALDGKKILSWIGYAHTDMTLGGMFMIRANVAYGQNAGNFGIATLPTPKTGNVDTLANDSKNLTTAYVAMATEESGSLKNSKHLEGYISPAIKFGPEFLLACGIGYEQEKSDAIAYDKADRQMLYFVNARVAFDKYFSITPELSYRDYMKDASGKDQGAEWYAGAKFQADIM